MGGGKSASKQASRDAKAARKDELARQARVQQGTAGVNQVFNRQFAPGYYNGIANSFRQFAMPQLQDQRNDANAQLMFDLARTGKLDSSSRATQSGKLQEAFGLAQTEIADKAMAAATDAKAATEDARSALIAQVNATGDATGAIQAANRRVSALAQPTGNYSPLANMFASFTNTLGQRYAAERAFAASGGQSRDYTPASYGARTGSMRVNG